MFKLASLEYLKRKRVSYSPAWPCTLGDEARPHFGVFLKTLRIFLHFFHIALLSDEDSDGRFEAKTIRTFFRLVVRARHDSVCVLLMR